jgi:uncharacterized protein (DUF58 family)
MPISDLGLDARFIQRLEHLTIIAKQRKHGLGAGGRRSPATGSAVEFADFRTYSAGDDFRRVDWNAFARLDRLFLRIFEADENTTVSIFIDCSRSMAAGDPPKARPARQLAASLAYIALASYDRVAVAGIADRLAPYMSPRSGRGRAPEVWRFISDLPESTETALDCLRSYRDYNPSPGLSIIITDMMTSSDWRLGIGALQGSCRQEVVLVQILSPDEIRPRFDGDWTLIDVETGQATEISVTPAVLRRYQATLKAYTAEIAGWCRQRNIHFMQVGNDVSIDDLIFRMLTARGVAK